MGHRNLAFQVARHDDECAVAATLERGKFHFGFQRST
jgi:hypothetical protein